MTTAQCHYPPDEAARRLASWRILGCVGPLSSLPIKCPRMDKAHPINGSYKILHMDEWVQNFVDEEVPGYDSLASDGNGEFQGLRVGSG